MLASWIKCAKLVHNTNLFTTTFKANDGNLDQSKGWELKPWNKVNITCPVETRLELSSHATLVIWLWSWAFLIKRKRYKTKYSYHGPTVWSRPRNITWVSSAKITTWWCSACQVPQQTRGWCLCLDHQRQRTKSWAPRPHSSPKSSS